MLTYEPYFQTNMKSFVNVSALSAVLLLFLFACGKHSVNEKKFYFQMEMDGEKVTLKDNRNGYSASLGESGQIEPGSIESRQESTIIPVVNPAEKPYVFWSLGANFPDIPNEQEIIDMCQPGSFSYFNGISEDSAPTAAIEWIDAAGEEWTTYYGSGDQTGSSFTITETTEIEAGEYYATCHIEFSCKLYDKDGNTIEVENGVAHGPIGLSD